MAEAPYPADTRAKGWRFELDHERIQQSDTWALAPAEVRPWLLMLWMTAWVQEPCGSLPKDDLLIAVRIGMPIKTFNKNRDALMRGWWLAADGRASITTCSSSKLAKCLLREHAAGSRTAQRSSIDVVPAAGIAAAKAWSSLWITSSRDRMAVRTTLRTWFQHAVPATAVRARERQKNGRESNEQHRKS